MEAALLLPDVVARSLGVGEREVQIVDDKVPHGSKPLVGARYFGPPVQHREDAQCRPIRLRPRPAADIQRRIRIDPGLGKHRRSRNRGDLGVGARVLEEGRLYPVPEIALTQKLPTVQTA